MNELTTTTIERALSSWYDPSDAFLDCKGMFLEEMFEHVGANEGPSREQYLQMTTKYDRSNKTDTIMTPEQFRLRSRALVMIDTVASSYKMGLSLEHCLDSLRLSDKGTGMAEVLEPWAKKLYALECTTPPPVSDDDREFALKIANRR